MPTFVSSCRHCARVTQRLLTLPARRQRQLLEALWSLSLAWLYVRVLPYRWWARRLGTPLPGVTPVPGVTPESHSQPDNLSVAIGRLVMAINRRCGNPFTCLMMAMAAHWMLGRRHIASRLVLGTRLVPKTPTDADPVLSAHAWVTVGGHVVLGQHDEAFTPITCFVHASPESPLRHGQDR
ncbi:lasso peptide biosynthesis B2 protein [Aidingimonas lacisalsi]|uniref:lasso peptide biosynthesis B2 protein n=1 Tax=Aidingimonas lacisalsi TaxID=2604086 RepID=UPI00137617D9|nr:lasso peptide biosynthesis B2 protein [Aidingimonas lacisalsi]